MHAHHTNYHCVKSIYRLRQVLSLDGATFWGETMKALNINQIHGVRQHDINQ